jgi:hypothetical protein
VVAIVPALVAAIPVVVTDIVLDHNLLAGMAVDWYHLLYRVGCPDSTEAVVEVVGIGEPVVDMLLEVPDHTADRRPEAARVAVVALVVRPILQEEVVAHKGELRMDCSMVDCLPSA